MFISIIFIFKIFNKKIKLLSAPILGNITLKSCKHEIHKNYLPQIIVYREENNLVQMLKIDHFDFTPLKYLNNQLKFTLYYNYHFLTEALWSIFDLLEK